MSSSTTLKELTKAINAFLGSPSVPLPGPLLDNISAFLQRHEEYDDAAADQLQETLLSIFEKRVKGQHEATGPWVAVLRRLLPVLQTPERVLPWFDACKGLLARDDLDKHAVDETVASMMDLVTLIDEHQVTSLDDPIASRIIHRLLELWMNRFYPALLEGNMSTEHNERLIRQALCHFGKKRPRELCIIVNEYFVQRKYRKSALRFLCDFIQIQPPHLHQVLHTPLFSNLLICLQHDTSTTVLSAALITLIMLLPHMPSSLVPHLPALFNVYGRLLFWDKARSGPTEHPDGDSRSVQAPLAWDMAMFEPEVDDQAISHLFNYYTILYGLYPLNFMDYIRKPQRYMRHANAVYGDELEAQPTEMRHRSEIFARNHLLHPNFFTLTLDSEKTDLGRWIKSEAAEVVAECMGLRLESHSCSGADFGTTVISGPDSGLDKSNEAGAALLSGSGSDTRLDSWRNPFPAADSVSSTQISRTAVLRRSSQSSIPSHVGSLGGGRTKSGPLESPTTPGASPSRPQPQDLIPSDETIQPGPHQSQAGDSAPSLPLSHQEMPRETADGTTSVLDPRTPTSRSRFSASDMSSFAPHLQKQILLLQNDLIFERYMKQQHMTHIGDLRRRQMAEAATEAEMQNLIMTNRNLKSRFEDAKKSEMQAKKESEKSRAMAKKWEADLTNRLKALRDDFKKMHVDMETVQKELHESRQECDKLRELLCAAEVRELNFRQNMQSLEMDSHQVESLKAEVERLTRSERDHQAKELERQAVISAAAEAEKQVEVLRMKLAAMEKELQRTTESFQSQIKALQAELYEAQEEPRRPYAKVNIAVENALAASRAKQAEMQKQYSLLLRKYTALQSSLLDMQSEQATQSQPLKPALSQQQLRQRQSTDADHASSKVPIVVKSQPHHTLSNPTAAGHSMNPPTGSLPGVSATGGGGDVSGGEGSGSGSGSGSSGSVSGPISPDQRHFGGFQRLRKDSRDRGKDDGKGGSGKPKKEKKSSGLRGIRGFV